MHSILNQMFRLGIPTYVQSIFSTVAATPSIDIAKQMPTQIGWIYGLSIYVDGVSPDNFALITLADAQSLFLLLKQGKENIVEVLRLDEFLFTSTQNIGCDERFYRINIWADNLSFDQSKYLNPTNIASGVIMLQLHYISIEDRDYLRSIGYLGIDGKITMPSNK